MKKSILFAASLTLLSSIAVHASETAINKTLVVANIQQALIENLAEITAENQLIDGHALAINIAHYKMPKSSTAEQDQIDKRTIRLIAD